MDDNNEVCTPENGAGYENGMQKQLLVSDELALMEKANAVSSSSLGNDELTASSGDSVTLNDIEGVDSSNSELTEITPTKEQHDSAHSSKELGVNERSGLKDDKLQKVAAKTKNEKLSGLKIATGLKKEKDVKEAMSPAASNGTPVSGARSEEPLGFRQKGKSTIEKHATDLKVNHRQPVAADANVNSPKQPGRPQPISPSTTVSIKETLTEKTKLRVVQKSASSKSEGAEQSSSPTTSEERTRNVGALPAYNFSFKCDERAERRREFYSKLEEKIQAKEAEKTDLQAKSKETQEAELRMLRKSLMFKATPMPSFYQEPAPPKAELRKVPPTRAKSPKLGRKKDSPNGASEEDKEVKTRPSRLSLDEKLSQSNLAMGSPINNVKKPLRKSLPSQKPSSIETKKSSAQKTNLSKDTSRVTAQKKKSSEELSGVAADLQKLDIEPVADPSNKQIGIDIEAVTESQTTLSNERISVAH